MYKEINGIKQANISVSYIIIPEHLQSSERSAIGFQIDDPEFSSQIVKNDLIQLRDLVKKIKIRRK